jgi:opacity protein-like surface antigen
MKRIIVAAVAAAALMAPAAEADQPVPADLVPPKGNDAYLSGHAVGVQIYSCNGTAWALVAPRANLYDRRGKLLATHFAGPTWQTKSGSSVVGKRETNVTVDSTAIDWLLLSAVSTTPGKLGKTTYIQRINTTGGLAPSGGCDASTSGKTVEVPYTADYVFFKARRACHGRLD